MLEASTMLCYSRAPWAAMVSCIDAPARLQMGRGHSAAGAAGFSPMTDATAVESVNRIGALCASSLCSILNPHSIHFTYLNSSSLLIRHLQ